MFHTHIGVILLWRSGAVAGWSRGGLWRCGDTGLVSGLGTLSRARRRAARYSRVARRVTRSGGGCGCGWPDGLATPRNTKYCSSGASGPSNQAQ
ncbi:hypothetical protein BGZ57DRAFT_592827 [Hyaloscypha finlandica]|nr:hypothetical protein BGZ57DRAFT_592827 [Hyaloscypha finlandica]KAH8798312.1 hypothetical protein F5882DRAFT_11431 [Hyaloscypha sp. PMI_1271]